MGNTMSNGSSQPEAPPTLPDGIEQLNGSVYELHRPEGVPKLEVIFFHGLQLSDYREAYWKTWLSRDQSVIWPKEWLGPRLRDARITSVSYDSSARQTGSAGNMKMYPIIENLIMDVVLSPAFTVADDCTIILVGHSLGGLIIKQLLLEISARAARLDPENPEYAKLVTFLNKCRGIFYYSTPHGGSELAAYAARADRIPGANMNMAIIEFLKVLSDETAQINNNFSNFRHTRKLNATTRALGETRDTKFMGLSKRVVVEASARQDIELYYSVPNADHFEVCKAENSSVSSVFTFLRDFCVELVPQAKAPSQAELVQLQ